MDSLREIAKSQSSYISFHDIFESYKNDAELNELIDQLILSIERIIDEGEEHLNSRLENDLKRLLEQIKGAKKASLYELGAWAEVTARIMLEIAGQKLDLPVTSLLVDAAKIAYKVKQNLASKYQTGESELVRLIEVKSVGTDFSALPEPNPESFRIIDSRVAASSDRTCSMID
ncbi:MAG: hypothetical protein RLZZ505_2373 [Verrucomicrobiota bacterium]